MDSVAQIKKICFQILGARFSESVSDSVSKSTPDTDTESEC